MNNANTIASLSAAALANLDRLHQAADTLDRLERMVAKAPRAVPPPRVRRSNAVSGVIAL